MTSYFAASLSHATHKTQPCDVGVFSPLKTAYREQVDLLYRGGAETGNKAHFTKLYSQARSVAMTSRNITLADEAESDLREIKTAGLSACCSILSFERPV